MVKTFQDVCGIEAEDGLRFDIQSIRGIEIKEDATYQGVRVTGMAELARAKIPFQVDVGFGDVVTPDPEFIEMPVFLNLPVPRLRAYPVYTVIAEKFQAMVFLGLANSRMKDFYDVWFLALSTEFDGSLLAGAIEATFARRETVINKEPLALFEGFCIGDKNKAIQWNAFVKKNSLSDVPDFVEIMHKLEEFLDPVYRCLANNQDFNLIWSSSDWRWKGS